MGQIIESIVEFPYSEDLLCATIDAFSDPVQPARSNFFISAAVDAIESSSEAMTVFVRVCLVR